MKAEKVRGNSVVRWTAALFAASETGTTSGSTARSIPAGQAVVAFAFAIGDAIPEERSGSEHNLVAEDGRGRAISCQPEL